MMISRSVSIRLHFLILWLEDYKPSWANYLNCQPIWRLVWWGLANSRKVEAFDFPKQAHTYTHMHNTHTYTCTTHTHTAGAVRAADKQLKWVSSSCSWWTLNKGEHHMEIGVMPLAHLARPKANIHTHTQRDREGEREREREWKAIG